MGKIQAVSEVAFWVDDVERGIDFYRSHFEFELVEHNPGQHAFLRSGDFLLVLFNPKDPGTQLGVDYLARVGAPRGGLYHVAFKTPREGIDALAEEVRASGVDVKGPVDFAGGRRSYFFDDPDGHYIELTDR